MYSRVSDAEFNLNTPMNPADRAIPILPSRSITTTAAFYRALGFEGGPHEDDSNYGILRRGSLELHFFTHVDLKPEDSWAGCYLRVADVQSRWRPRTWCRKRAVTTLDSSARVAFYLRPVPAQPAA